MDFKELCEDGDVCEKIVADGLPNFRYLYETHCAYNGGRGVELRVPLQFRLRHVSM